MAEIFPKAPITEGLIDIRAQLPGNITLTDLEKLHTEIKDTYPNKKNRKMWEATLELKDEKEPLKSAHFEIDGYLLSTVDEKQVVQYHLDGFTFSRLRPYTRWEEVYPEASRLWTIYRTAVNPVLVTRLAVRYINSIEIPSKSFDYDDYLTGAPKIPPGLPQSIQGFLSRIEVPFPDRGVVAIITQAPSDKQDAVKTAIILDIDVFAHVNFQPDDARIDEMLNMLRATKNEVFLNSITDRTKELFR